MTFPGSRLTTTRSTRSQTRRRCQRLCASACGCATPAPGTATVRARARGVRIALTQGLRRHSCRASQPRLGGPCVTRGQDHQCRLPGTMQLRCADLQRVPLPLSDALSLPGLSWLVTEAGSKGQRCIPVCNTFHPFHNPEGYCPGHSSRPARRRTEAQGAIVHAQLKGLRLRGQNDDGTLLTSKLT